MRIRNAGLILCGALVSVASTVGCGTEDGEGEPPAADECAEQPASGAVCWAKRFGDATSQSAEGVAVDGSRNIFLTGEFLGGIDFGVGEHQNRKRSERDIFLAKLDRWGAPLWSRSFGSTSSSVSTAGVSVNAHGDSLLTGGFRSPVDFGQGALPPNLSEEGSTMYLASFDGDTGATLFSRGFAGSDILRPMGAVLDDQNNMIVTGEFMGSANFGGDVLTSSSDDMFDMFVAKVGADGGHLWSRRFGHSGSSVRVTSIADGGMNSVVITGWVTGPYVVLGCDELYHQGNLESSDWDVFVVKLSSVSGSCLWSKRAGDDLNQRGRAVAAGANGDVIVVGDFQGRLDEELTAVPGPGTSIFVLKYDLDGRRLWGKQTSYDHGASPSDVAVDPTGAIALTGRYATFEQDVISDVFVIKLDASGDTRWSRSFGNDANDFVGGIALDGSGKTILTGAFFDTLELDGVPLRSSGGSDIFLTKLSP